MDKENHQEKILQLTDHLERELKRLKSAHVQDLEQLREIFKNGIGSINDAFESIWDQFNARHAQRIMNLEEQVRYLKELNDSQRTMMEDNLIYIRDLEQMLSSQAPDAGKRI